MNIKITKNSSIPAYKQIVDQIKHAISNGFLKTGDKLHPERDLAKDLGIARGTITKAYLELENEGVVSVSQGKGTFVANQKRESGNFRASALVSSFINDMISLDFSSSEIERMVTDALAEREREKEPVFIAAIDCNPEALAIYEKQLFPFPETHIVKLLLDSLPEGEAGAARLEPYDLLLTTTTHQSELITKYPVIKTRLMAVSVAPTTETITRLARLSSSIRVGVICESKRFFSIIQNHLKDSAVAIDYISSIYISELNRLPEFLSQVDAVIIPPSFSLMQRKEQISDIQKFTERGGLVLPFDYRIDKGSLIHLGEKIKTILESR